MADDITDQVYPNGLPAVVANPNGAVSANLLQQLLQMQNSPEMQARKQEIYDASKAAIDQQKAGIAQNESGIQALQQKGPGLNFAPIASLVDNWTGSNLASAVPKTQTPQEFQQNILTLQNALQAQKKGLSDEQIQLLKEVTNPQAQNQLLGMSARVGQGDQRIGMREDQMSTQAVDAVNKDPVLKAAIPRVQGLDRILNQLEQAESGKFKLTPQFLSDVNAEYTAAITGRNNFSEGSAEQKAYDNASTNWTKLQQYINSNAQDINSPKVVAQIKAQAQGLLGDWRKTVDDQAQLLQRDYPHVPQAQAAQKRAINKMIGTYGTKVSKEQAPTPITGPPVDADLTKMTPEQLQNYIDTHGGQ